ncbi:hypothetical protein ACFU5O_26485 [Streptomyces sp. NPDC057445]|uniref:hypothetical protein n=1 Tax=Streptomyces sp. NPDC057445 TaxID=3346136 RepID=UPI0036C36491
MNAKKLRTAVLVVATLMATGLAAPAVNAAPGHGARTPVEQGARPALDVTAGGGDLAAPDTARPGPATFRVTATDLRSGHVGLVRLREGATLDAFRTGLRKAFSDDPAVVVEGNREVTAQAELVGGALTLPGSPGSFSLVLRPGTYHLLEYRDFQDGTVPAGRERIRALTVSGTPHGRLPSADATVVSETVPGEGPRFRAPGRLRAGERVRFVNFMGEQVNEAVFYKLFPGKTDADVQKFFTGPDWNDLPFDPSANVGSPPLSPGRSTVLAMTLTPGRWALVTWVGSAVDGGKLAARGMHTVITVQ